MLDFYNITLPFRITGIYTAFDFSWDSDGVFKGESHDFWEIVTVLSGQMEVVEDDRYYILGEGMTVCHAPGEYHRLKSAGGTSPHFAVVTFGHEGKLPEKLKDGIFALDKDKLREYLEILRVFISFYHECRARVKNGEKPRDAELSVRCAVLGLERFLLSLSESDVSETEQTVSGSVHEYRALVRIMTERVSDNLSLSELAGVRHISESYVKKLFHTYAGEGAMSYYARLRTSEIKRLLHEGRTVSEIAEIMNFSSVPYLSTFFKKQTGMTPCEYEKRK